MPWEIKFPKISFGKKSKEKNLKPREYRYY